MDTALVDFYITQLCEQEINRHLNPTRLHNQRPAQRSCVPPMLTHMLLDRKGKLVKICTKQQLVLIGLFKHS